MPSSATLTSFYSFTSGTKARAAQVNANFDAFRGHILPINPNTSTAINNTYDLGSSEYRWRTNYVQQIDFQSNTSTGNAITLRADTSTTYGGLILEAGGSEIFRISKNSGLTTSAARGQRAYSSNIVVSTLSAAATTITASQISINSSGKPVKIELICSNTATSSIGFVGNTTTSVNANMFITLYANGAQIAQSLVQADFNNSTTSTGISYDIPPSQKWIYVLPTGTSSLYVVVNSNSGATTQWFLNNVVLTAKEEY